MFRSRSKSPGHHASSSSHSHSHSGSGSAGAGGSVINFFPYYKVKVGKRHVTLPYNVLSGGKLKGKYIKFMYNGVKTTVRCKNVQPMRNQYK